MKKIEKYLHYGQQRVDNDDIKAVVKVLKSDFLTTGPEVEKFETALKIYTESKYAVVCSSGSTALSLAYMAIGIDRNSTVFMPTITFAATANAAKVLGANVIFCDCCSKSGIVKPEYLLNSLKKNSYTNGFFIGVHMNGQSMDLSKLKKICDTNKVKFIEDASHALGTTYISKNGKEFKIGSCKYSEMTTFSFHPVKTITMGEGGAVTTNSKKMFDLLRLFRNNGIERLNTKFKNYKLSRDKNGIIDPSYYELHKIGFNFRASDIACALGGSQLKKMKKILIQRKKLVAYYDFFLKKLRPYIKPINKFDFSNTLFHLYVILIDFSKLSLTKVEFMKQLKNKNIGSMVHYIPLHLQPTFSSSKEPNLKEAEKYYKQCLSIPLHTNMTKKDVNYVVNSLELIIKSNKL